MFKRLRIDGFRSFEDFRLDSLGRFNLIVGPGDSGKTNLLEAVFLACSNGDASLLHKEQGLRRIQYDSLLPAEIVSYYDFAWSVWNESVRFTIEATWDDDDRKITFTRMEREEVVPIAAESTGTSKPEDDVYPKESLAGYEVETLLNGGKHVGRLVVTPSQIMFRGDGAPNISARYAHPFFQALSRVLAPFWTQIEDSREDDAVLRLLRSFDSGVEGIRIASNQAGLATVRVHHKFLGRLPVEMFGAGFGKALSIATYAVAAEGGVLILDELDASLHVGVQAALIEFLLSSASKHNVQVFASTHSLETLDAFLDCFDNVSDLFSGPSDLQILQLSKANGRTRVKQADASEARMVRHDLGLDLRRTR